MVCRLRPAADSAVEPFEAGERGGRLSAAAVEGFAMAAAMERSERIQIKKLFDKGLLG